MEFHIPQIVKDHPYIAGVSVFVVGLLVLYELGYFSPAQASGGGDPTMAAYYQAEAAAQQSGNALAIAQDHSLAEQAIAKTAAGAAVDLAKVSAGRDVDLAKATGAANTDLATIFANRDTTLGNAAAGIANAQTAGAVTLGLADTARDVTLGSASIARDVTLGGYLRDTDLASFASAERINHDNVTGAYDITKLNADAATTIAAGDYASRNYIAGIMGTVEQDRIAGAVAEQGNLVNSVTSSYQSIGNYPLETYLANLSALSPNGSQLSSGTPPPGNPEYLNPNPKPVSGPAPTFAPLPAPPSGGGSDYFSRMFPHGVG